MSKEPNTQSVEWGYVAVMILSFICYALWIAYGIHVHFFEDKRSETRKVYPGEQAAIERTKRSVVCGEYTLEGISGLEVQAAEGDNPIVLVVDPTLWKAERDTGHLRELQALAEGSFALPCTEWSNATHPVFWVYTPSDPVLASWDALIETPESGDYYRQHRRSTIAKEIARIAERYGVKVIAQTAGPALHWAAPLVEQLGLMRVDALVIQATGDLGGNVPPVHWTLNSDSLNHEPSDYMRYDGATDFVHLRRSGEIVDDYDFYTHLREMLVRASYGDIIFTTGSGEDGSWDMRATACGVAAPFCVALPYEMQLVGAEEGNAVLGTANGPPRLAMALASIAMRYPGLTPSELAFLTQACAVGKKEFHVSGMLSSAPLGQGAASFQCLYRSGSTELKTVEELRAMIQAQREKPTRDWSSWQRRP